MNILFGTDGSRYALAAARFLASWCPDGGVKVDLVAVTPRVRRSLHRDFGKAPDVGRQWRAAAKLWLDDTARPLRSHGFKVTERRRIGVPAQVISEVAEDGEHDLVVVGARGRSDAPFFDVGSVALATLEHAPTAVLMVREREAKHRGRRVPSELAPFQVLIPTDGEPHSLTAIRRFLALVRIPHLEVHLVTAFTLPDTGLRQPLSPGARQRLRARAERAARQRLQEAAQLVEARRMRTQMRALEGEPTAAILEAALEAQADLIVLGSRGVRRLAELHLGSVALQVARSAPCSVLVIRRR
ncbi:MAG: universal stress protein [Gemmatimonadetes bacterium]|nr:universal stress protein [Gemmatimonadota bacterium]